MNRVHSFSILVAVATLVGCGGGGGGKSRGGGVLALSFVADAGTASGPVGASHRIVVYRNDGTIVDTKTVDTSSGTANVSLSGLPAGTLRLHVGLSATAGGPELGAVDTTFQGGSAPAPMTFTMRQTPVSVAVTPTVGSVAVGSTFPLYVAAKDSSGAYVYEAPSDWTWSSSNPGFATVDASGVATGKAEGNATISAALAGTSLSGSSNLGILANGVRQGKWTVMVFLNAANSLYTEAVNNINQMERAANNPDVRFVVQWKQTAETGQAFNQDWSGTRRYLVGYDTRSAVASTVVQDLGGGVDMGSASALSNFVSWTKSKYPADHYALVVWNHGAGWNTPLRKMSLPSRGVSYDDETGNHLDLPDVASALRSANLDVLAYDACLMQGAEDLMEMASAAKYIVASEENTPGPGFPYDKVFAPIVADADTSARSLVAAMPAAFTNYYATSSDYRDWALHLSALDTSKITSFRTALDNFSLALTSPTANLGSLMTNVRAACNRMDPSGTYDAYYDLDQIAEKTAALTQTVSPNVSTTATALRTALTSLVVASSTSPSGTYMHGLSIEFGKSSKYATYANYYEALQLAQLTNWDEFLASTTANP